MWRIEHLTIEGFRGLNKRVEMPFDRRSPIVLLKGRNGFGKTSTLQAIEWCLTGSVMFFSGGDFTREDALVNLFHPDKKGFVEMILTDDQNTIKITRSKKMGRSTGRGGSWLEVVIDGDKLTDENAESRVQKTLFDSVDEPAALFHLHQDSIRQILMADPKERSRGIDKILGTFEVRDFLDSLDIKRKLTQTFKKLESEKSSLERDRVQVATAEREKLNIRRKGLEERGWKDRLDSKATKAEIENIRRELKAIANQVQFETSIHSTDIDAGETKDVISRFRSELQRLDRSRITSASTMREKTTSLRSAIDQYGSAGKALESLAAEKPEDAGKKQELTNELQKLDAELSELNKRKKLLEEPTKNARKLDLRIQELSTQLAELTNLIGSPDTQKASMNKLRETVQTLQEDAKRFSGEKQLVALALEYLELTKPELCPLCFQKIEPSKVIERLRSEFPDQKVEKTMRDVSNAREQLRKLEADIVAFNKFGGERTELDIQLRKALSEVNLTLHEELRSVEELRKAADGMEERALSIQKRRTELTAMLQGMSERTKILEQSRIMQGEAATKLQQIMQVKVHGEELLAKAAEAVEKLRGSEQKLADSKEIDRIGDSLDSVAEAVAYLEDMKGLEALEREIPKVEKVAKDLEKRLTKVVSMEASISSIQEILSAHLKDSVADLLGSLETTINDYYSAISGHPFFVKIRLETDPKKPLIYNVRASTKDETISTYIPTRFSSAQMNCAGIALFLAHAKKMMNQLAATAMDDPTQSLDEAHKEGLVRLIKELSETRQVFVATPDEEFVNLLEESCGQKLATWNYEDWGEQGAIIEAV